MAQQYSPEVDQMLDSLAQRHRVSRQAVDDLLVALDRGGGSMAQFSIPELGGHGQWMKGGMTMAGNMFDHELKSCVNSLCSELSALLASRRPVFEARSRTPAGAGRRWWPDELGEPSSRGGQNDTEYAYFPRARRLAVRSGDHVRVYDTLDHSIGGVSQQQGVGPGSLQFSSQHGNFGVSSLPQIGTDDDNAPTEPPPPDPPRAESDRPATSAESIIASIEALAGLHARGIISDAEFSAKKAELLSRL